MEPPGGEAEQKRLSSPCINARKLLQTRSLRASLPFLDITKHLSRYRRERLPFSACRCVFSCLQVKAAAAAAVPPP